MNESENDKGNEKEKDDRTRTLDKMCKFFFSGSTGKCSNSYESCDLERAFSMQTGLAQHNLLISNSLH